MKKVLLPVVAITCAAVLSTACQQKKTTESNRVVVPGIDTTAMDKSVNPKADFYRYVNGGWMTANPLKDEYGSYGSFHVLADSAQSIARHIIEHLDGSVAGSDEAKAKTLYTLAMNEKKLNEDGASPIKPELDRIDAINEYADLVNFLAENANNGTQYLFHTYVGVDNDNSTKHILNLVQPSLIMGDQDYYQNKPEYKPFQDGYLTYIAKLLTLAGTEEAEASKIAQNVYNTEKRLCDILYTKVQLRESELNWNKMDRATFFGAYTFPWGTYFNQRKGLEAFEHINVAQKDYFKKFDTFIKDSSISDLKEYFKVITLHHAADYLSSDFRVTAFEFNGKLLSGLMEMQPRWKDAVDLVDGTFGEVVGKIYVKEHFPAAAKERMSTLVENLKIALSERIASLTWMSDETKKNAQEKLAAFRVKIGYPDKWEGYEALEVDDSSLYAFLSKVGKYETEKNIADLNKPVDLDKWYMNPHTVNAYYNPTTNEICFPAGILQPPFFNLDADDPVNYGAIGVVIGHEMTHGFDDQGRKYDKDGNMVNWWTEEDATKFKASASKLVDQFNQIIVVDDVHADGENTLGENIADQGGLIVSFGAMKKAMGDAPRDLIDGMTPEQRFFVAYARVWGQNIRKETILRLTKVDVHSLGEWRVNQALRNIPAFYEAFDIKEGDPMYLAPEDRVLVW
ncbi:M13 family metallopeptidase [Porphyromonas sp.]|uniref:M13 family metallopeptidase n=1 Tax=Porphyromonas sp. TaxID=1924944 RepID=UPI0026DC634C|nr:M13 family metallopeptidase [Porphyromonas sp.]MDO4695244.1 M13 family metallopeptidase [Porphyromonas sp.]MDO4771067.1 M13 family metallopeptidase [Porphyromonas sp.]